MSLRIKNIELEDTLIQCEIEVADGRGGGYHAL